MRENLAAGAQIPDCASLHPDDERARDVEEKT